jgi:hypothetical protein
MFAPRGVSLIDMNEQRPKSILVSMRASELRGRGAVYKWLNKHHRTVTRGFERTESTWEGVIDALVADGVTNRKGGRPSPNSVLKVWQRVCEDRAARAQKAMQKQPKRLRPVGDWDPPVTKVRQGASTRPAPTSRDKPKLNPSTVSANGPGAGTTGEPPDHAQAALAAIRRKLAHVDRHIIRSADED